MTPVLTSLLWFVSVALAAEVLVVPSGDGAEVALTHHAGPGQPVIVVHGLSSNHHSWDLAPGRSLAETLVAAGLDVWLLDLRGHGHAERLADGRRQPGGWTVDTYGLVDVPAAVDAVLAATGAERLAYVGHSMGGMVGAIYAGSRSARASRLSSMVVVGSPLDFADADALTDAALWLMRASAPVSVRVPSPWASRVHGRVGRDGGAIDALLFTDISEPYRSLAYERVVSPIVRGELRQLGRAGPAGAFVDAEGSRSWLDASRAIEVPILALAGKADRVAPPSSVLPWAEGVGERVFVVAGRDTGFAADYGHLDLAFGDHAAQEIYPRIAAWILDHP